MDNQEPLDEPEPLTGTDLRAMRKRAGLTQSELAERFGVDRTTLVRWERGYRYRGGRERAPYPIPDAVHTQLLLVIAEARAERRQLAEAVQRRVGVLSRA